MASRGPGYLLSLPPLPPINQQQQQQRSEQREAYSLRPVYFTTKQHGTATGSCYYSAGETRITCSIWGPRRRQTNSKSEGGATSGVLTVSVAVCPFVNFKPMGRVTALGGGSGLPGQLEREGDATYARLPSLLLDALTGVIILDSFPNSEVIAALTVIEDEGGLVAAAINATALALASAGIPMRDLPAAVTVGIFVPKPLTLNNNKEQIPHTEAPVLDPKNKGKKLRPAKARLLAKQQQQTVAKKKVDGPLFLVDPTDEELRSGLGGDWEPGLPFHLALCPSDRSAAMIKLNSFDLKPEAAAQLFQVAEAACCQLSATLRETIKTQFAERESSSQS